MSNEVILEVYPHFDPADLDIISLYFENKKQSDGGDILRIKAEAQNRILVNFEDNETKQRILAKKFFSFKNYLIRSSENGFKSEPNEADELSLILRNIERSEDAFVVEIYAEHLQSDNEILCVEKSEIFQDTWLVHYKEKVDRDALNKRLSKRPRFRIQLVDQLDAFKTNTLIIHVTKTYAQLDKISLRNQISQLLENYNEKLQFFIEELVANKCFLLEFSNLSAELIDALKKSFSDDETAKKTEVIIENCRNFNLLNFVETKNVEKFLNKSIQTTDLTKKNAISQTDSVLSTNEPVNLKKPDSASSQLKDLNKPAVSIIEEPNSFPKINLNLTNNDPNKSILILDPRQFYSIGFLNARQLLESFQSFLKQKIDQNLTALIQNNTVVIQNLKPLDDNWKLKVENELGNFFATKGFYKTLPVSNEVLNNQNKVKKLKKHLDELNENCHCAHFRLESNEVKAYGTRAFTLKHYDLLKSMINELAKETVNKDTVSAPMNTFVKLDVNSLLNLCVSNIKSIQLDLEQCLKSSYNATIQFEQINCKVRCALVCWLDLSGGDGSGADSDKWKENMRHFLKTYETNRLADRTIRVSALLKINPKEINDNLKTYMDQLYKTKEGLRFELTPDLIRVYGLKDPVNSFAQSVQNKAQQIETELRQKLNQKLSFKLLPSNKPLLSVLLQFNGVYFKEFIEMLKKFEASAEKLNDEIGFRIKCTSASIPNQTLKVVEDWRKKVDLFIKNYFSLFSCKKVSPVFNRNEANLKMPNLGDLVKLIWLDENTVELTGLNSEVDKAIKCLTSLEANNKLNNNLNQANIKKEANAETFIISDLKWFQTRILFEKKYFDSMSERFKDLSVMVDAQMTRIIYNGNKRDIQQAKNEAFEVLESIMGTEVEASVDYLHKLNQNEAALNGLLKQNNLICVVDAKKYTNKYTIYGTEYTEIEKCKYLLSNLKF